MEVPASAIRWYKEIRRIQIGKEGIKLSLFADDDLKELTKKYDKVSEHKVNKQKLITFLYATNEQTESEF